MGIPDIDQCNIVAKGGRMVVRHGRSCESEYCAADFQCEQTNRRIRRFNEEGVCS